MIRACIRLDSDNSIYAGFWLPLIPFVIWIGGVIGYLITVIETVIASQIWAAAHMHPDGEGIASQHAASGYQIVIELILRPVFMVLGFLMSVVSSRLIMDYVSGAFFNSIDSVTADSLAGAATFVATIVIYVAICWIVINMCYKMIESVPAGAMNMIGGRQGSNVHDGGEANRSVYGAMVVGVNKASGGLAALKQRKNSLLEKNARRSNKSDSAVSPD